VSRKEKKGGAFGRKHGRDNQEFHMLGKGVRRGEVDKGRKYERGSGERRKGRGKTKGEIGL
jgi:hypothetical protein